MKLVQVSPAMRSGLTTKRPQEHVQMSKGEAKSLLKEIHGMDYEPGQYPTVDKLAKLMKVDMDAPFPFEGDK